MFQKRRTWGAVADQGIHNGNTGLVHGGGEAFPKNFVALFIVRLGRRRRNDASAVGGARIHLDVTRAPVGKRLHVQVLVALATDAPATRCRSIARVQPKLPRKPKEEEEWGRE